MIRFAIAVYLVLILPRLWTFGMFLDGTIYASIARNMAEGVGRFNAPYYTDSMGEIFYWHPPLAMWLHSLLYRLLGDYTLVDTLFGFIMGSVSLYLVFQIFRITWPHEKRADKGLGWTAILLLTLMPMTSWIFSNNMLEVAMTAFVLASVFFQLRGMTLSDGNMAVHFFLAGGFLALAVLSKNVAGLFPLALPMLHYILFRKITFKKVFSLSILLTASLLSCIWAILYVSNSIEFYKIYLHHQLLPSVAGQLAGESTSFLRNAWLILSELIVGVAVSVLVMIIFKKWREIKINRLGIFFLVLGISGTLPLFFIPKFRSFYLYPGLPFFALSMAVFFTPAFHELNTKFTDSAKFRRYINTTAALLTMVAAILFFVGKEYPARLKEFKRDVYDVPLEIPARSHIADCWATADYTLIAAFQRYYKVSLLKSYPKNPGWILEDKNKPCDMAPKCQKINRQDSLRYNVYECAPVIFK